MTQSESILKSSENFFRTLNGLKEAIRSPITEDRDMAGIIKYFEMTYETSWRLLQKIAREHQLEVNSPKQALEAGFQLALIENEKAWLEIKDDRNNAVHTYNQELAKELCARIKSQHVFTFEIFASNL